ncbi:hypothetical protein K2X33_13245 [bacterium]|nr:hypothetical protein [bacterium]
MLVPLQKHLRALALLLSVTALAQGAEVPSTAICKEKVSERGKSFELGLVYQSLLPSGLPDLKKPEPVYGAVVGIPLYVGTLQIQGSFGGSGGLALYLAEANYRLEMPTPYFNAFALFGAHYLHYVPVSSTQRGAPGATIGLGMALLLDESFELVLGLKTYLQKRSTISFGLGFSFLI